MKTSLSSYIAIVALTAATFCPQSAQAADGCCGNSAPVPIFPRIVPAVPLMISPPMPCCGALPLLPLLPPAPTAITPGGLLVDGYGFAVPGLHARYPYYDYRAPNAVPGPPHFYRNIIW